MSPVRPVDAVFFDLFGTLVSLGPLDEACERVAPGRGPELAARWRARQLETSWLRTAMDRWADFDTVTRDALSTTLNDLGIAADEREVGSLADAFGELPLVGEAAGVVGELHAAGLATGILTNASTGTLDRVAPRLGLPLDHRLSVDAARRYKPHPAVYELAQDATGLPRERIGFVTANGWDAAGAGAFGFRVAWLRPTPTASFPPVSVPAPVIVTWPEAAAHFLGGAS